MLWLYHPSVGGQEVVGHPPVIECHRHLPAGTLLLFLAIPLHTCPQEPLVWASLLAFTSQAGA